MKKIVVLRPQPAASATVERATAQGLEVKALPLFELKPIAWDLPDPATFDAILLTSANAVRFGGSRIEDVLKVPVHAVGQATADAAKDAGLNVVTVGQGGVADLLQSLPRDLRLLHLRGREHIPMKFALQPLTSVTVYGAEPKQSVEGIEALDNSVALIHSPRAGSRLAALVDEARLDRSRISVVAISLNAALAAGTGWQQIKVADAPNDASLLALAARLCKNGAGE